MKFARPINDKTPNITSTFSATHKGVDYGYPDGTPIYAADEGRIILLNKDETRSWTTTNGKPLTTADYGNFIKIQHNNGYATLYAHLKHGSLMVKIGDYVKKGQKISEVGSTGYSTGNHLHWELRRNEVQISPYEHLHLSFDGYFDTEQIDYKLMWEREMAKRVKLEDRIKRIKTIVDE